MARLAPTSPPLRRRVTRLLRRWLGQDAYRPERHYMRGGRAAPPG
ncbi:hypothetical protein [Pseudoroseomonas sp. WGS1072]